MFSSVYGDALYGNMQNYSNVLSAYTQGQGALSSGLSGAYAAYDAVGPQVAGVLGYGGTPWGVAAPAAQDIARTFAQTQGRTDQSMINAGLGNSTLRGSLQNQNTLMAGQAYGNLGAQLAQTYAGYYAQTGLAAAGARMQGALAQSNLYGQEGATLASMQGRFGGYGGYGSGGGGGGGGVREGVGGIGSQFGQPMMRGGQAWDGGDPNANLRGQMGTYSNYSPGNYGGGGYGYDPNASIDLGGGGSPVDSSSYGTGGDFGGGGFGGDIQPDMGSYGDY